MIIEQFYTILHIGIGYDTSWISISLVICNKLSQFDHDLYKFLFKSVEVRFIFHLFCQFSLFE